MTKSNIQVRQMLSRINRRSSSVELTRMTRFFIMGRCKGVVQPSEIAVNLVQVTKFVEELSTP